MKALLTILLSGLAVLIGLSILKGIKISELRFRYGGVVRKKDSTALFWLCAAIQLFLIIFCLWAVGTIWKGTRAP